MDEKTADSCKRVMIRLGECMDRMAKRGFREKESWLCMKISNSVYLMCLYIQRMKNIEDPYKREQANFFFEQAFRALYEACQRYADAPDDDVADGIIEGMKALLSFERAKQTIQSYLRISHSDSESSTSQSD